MTNRTNTNLIVCSGLALALVLTIWSSVQSQTPGPAEGKKTVEGTKMGDCKEMMQQRHKMMEDMKAQDAELTELVAKMNGAPEDKKVDLMANIITKMVEQRAAMTGRMEKMHMHTMQHMMQHMEKGKESMSQCPMMKGMKDMGDKSGNAPKEHQEETR